MNDPNRIAKRLKALRESTPLSLRAMAQELGMPPSSYNHYESEVRFKRQFLPMDIAIKIADILAQYGIDRQQVIALAASDEVTGSRPAGFTETVAPFTFREQPAAQDDPLRALRMVFGSAAPSPGTHKITESLPVFSLRANDVLLLDLSRSPVAGELALISTSLDQPDVSVAVVARYMPPWLMLGNRIDQPLLRADDPNITPRFPVVGVLRGLPET